jgi:xanthine dehydrogenase YagS FAD-binding subunit
MKNFTYYRPATVAQAVGLLENNYGNTELLAGGTDLLALQKNYIAQPTRVVSLNAIQNFAGISQGPNNQFVEIGAGVKLADIAAHALLRQHFPALTSTADIIGGPQIRNMGTLGGNLAQRNRCWYFRDEHVNCWLKGGQTCFAIAGDNRYHAIFTQPKQPCVIVHPSTLAPVLIALSATVNISGPNNQTRNVPLEQIYRAPNQPRQREHNLAANEVITSVRIPMNNRANAAYEVRHKQCHDWPAVQAAVCFTRNATTGVATNVRIVLGHVAPTPYIATAAATALDGQAVNVARATTVGQAATQGNRPLSQNEYKVRLVQVAVKRALLIAAGQPRYWEV